MNSRNMINRNTVNKGYQKIQDANWIYTMLSVLIVGCVFWAPKLDAHTKGILKGFGGSYVKCHYIGDAPVLAAGGMGASIYDDTVLGFIGVGGQKIGYFGAYSAFMVSLNDTVSVVPNLTAAYGNYVGDPFMFMDPGVNLEIKISEHVKSVVGINYRVAHEKEDMNGMSITLGTQTGMF